MRDPARRQLVEDVIRRELQSKGLARASGRPALLVSYSATAFRGEDTRRGRDPLTEQYRLEWQGTFTVDLVDAETQKVVWHGEAWTRDPDQRVGEQVIAELIRRYPR